MLPLLSAGVPFPGRAGWWRPWSGTVATLPATVVRTETTPQRAPLAALPMDPLNVRVTLGQCLRQYLAVVRGRPHHNLNWWWWQIDCQFKPWKVQERASGQ